MMWATQGSLHMLAGGLGVKARVQHPEVKPRKDRAGWPWIFRYRAEEVQPDGSLKTLRKYREIGPMGRVPALVCRTARLPLAGRRPPAWRLWKPLRPPRRRGHYPARSQEVDKASDRMQSWPSSPRSLPCKRTCRGPASCNLVCALRLLAPVKASPTPRQRTMTNREFARMPNRRKESKAKDALRRALSPSQRFRTAC